MPALESHTGLLRTTIPFYNRRNFVDLGARYNWYTIFPALKGMMNRAIESKWNIRSFGLPTEVTNVGGTSFKFNVQVASNNGAAWVSADDPVPIQKKDFQVQGDLPWRLARIMDYSYDDWELSTQNEREKIVDLVVQRVLGNEQGAADFLENWGWNPPPASTDDKTAFPIRYYLYTEPESVTASYSANATLGTGVNGNRLAVNHASYTSGPAAISRLTYPRSAPFNCQYTGFANASTSTDLWNIYTIACMETDWSPPVDSPALAKPTTEKMVYTTRDNIVTKGILARSQNDANTSDLNARITDTEFYRVPWVRVPYFNGGDFTLYGASGSHKDVVYGVDWSKWHWASKTGFVMQDAVFPKDRSAPLTTTHARWLGGQLVCLDASTSFVLSK